MSVPSSNPNYQRLHQSVQDYVAYNQNLLFKMEQKADADEARVIDAFYSVFQFINDEFDKKADLSRVDIKRISNRAFTKISQIFKSKIYQNHSAYFHEQYIFIFHYLRQELKAFEKVIPHKQELNAYGLESFLDTSWGWKQLEQLAKIGDPWALQTLHQLILNNNDKIFPFLIKNFDFKSLQPLVVEYKDHPFLKENLEIMLLKNKKEKQRVYKVIEIVLKQVDWPWGERVLESCYQEDMQAKETLENIFREQNDLSHFINRFMLEQLSQDTQLGVSMVAEVTSCPYRKEFSLSPLLIQMAKDKKNIHFDMLLLALATLSYKKNGLLREVKEILKELEKGHGLPIGHYQKILQHLFRKRKELFSGGETVLSDQSRYRKASYTGARAFQLFALREHELILSLRNNLNPQSTNMEPTCEYFPSVKALIVGVNEQMAYFSRAVADFLSPYKITVYSPLLPDEKLEETTSSYVRPLKSSIAVNIWMQDSFFIARSKSGQNFFQYPYWIEIDRDLMGRRLKQRLKYADSDRYQKLKIKDHRYRHMHKVSDDCKQLQLLNFMIQTNGIHTASIDNHQFQYTYNEGGNCIIGHDEEGPYALVGKDAVELNRMVLSQEITRLGFIKNKDNQWEQAASDVKIKVKLTDDDLKKFFARDLKIKDPNRVYFIEQADYHLDMVMALVGKRKAILNDSLLAYEKIKRQVEKKSKAMDFFDANQTNLRLKMLKQQAEKNKVLEDVAALDLQKNGFEVVRFAGVFSDVLKNEPQNHRTNLFNYLSLTTPDNQKIIIALGCSEEYQDHFKTMIKDHCEVRVDHIHFLNQEYSEALLAKEGGVHCMTKYLQELL